jgi:hypothetical protein
VSHGSEGSILAGCAEEPCLQDPDVPLQGEGVDVPPLTQEPCLCLIGDLGSLQEPVQRSDRSMVSLLDPAASSHLLQEGHGGLEDVGMLGKQCFQSCEVVRLTLRIEPGVPQAPARQRPVLALHVRVVVLVPGPGTEGDPGPW